MSVRVLGAKCCVLGARAACSVLLLRCLVIVLGDVGRKPGAEGRSLPCQLLHAFRLFTQPLGVFQRSIMNS